MARCHGEWKAGCGAWCTRTSCVRGENVGISVFGPLDEPGETRTSGAVGHQVGCVGGFGRLAVAAWLVFGGCR